MPGDEQLFDLLEDLEAQAESAYDAERQVDLADRSRAEYREVTLAARLVASLGRELDVDVAGVGPVRGVLDRTGDGWLLLRAPASDWVVRTAALQRVVGASDRAVPEAAWSPLQRLSVASLLRRLADSGSRCVVHTRDGGRHEVVVSRVGADFVEVTEGTGATRRPVLVALDGLAAVQSAEPEL